MAVSNFSLPFASLSANLPPWSPSVSPLHPAHQELITNNNNNLLYSPADHQQKSSSLPALNANFYKNNPYAPPEEQQHQPTAFHFNNGNSRRKNTYLPPPTAPAAVTHRNAEYFNQPPSQYQHFHLEQQQSQQQRQQFSQHLHINAQQRQQQQSHQQQPQLRISASNSYSHVSSASHVNHLKSLHESNHSLTSQYFNSLHIPTQQQEQQQQQQPQQSQQKQLTVHRQSYKSQQQEQSDENRVSITTKPASVYAITNSNQLSAVKFNSAVSADKANKVDNPDGQQSSTNLKNNVNNNNLLPERPFGFTRVQGGHGSRTQVHAILDYDIEDDEEDETDQNTHHQFYPNESTDDGIGTHIPYVTPIQGPIFIENGTVPVVPLFSHPLLNNGTLVQIPIWWTALSVALGLSVQGDLVKGVPCIKRFHQLFCPTAGNSYPIEKIEHFIDENKALMRRMYGDFEMNMPSEGGSNRKRKKRFIDEPDEFLPPDVHSNDEGVLLSPKEENLGDTYFGQLRYKRQSNKVVRLGKQLPNKEENSSTGRLDVCESKIEIVTPYWASNSAGKVRAIVNTKHFEQAIHQEMCSKIETSRCKNDCGCEQKYKWHRLLAYDPDNDCKGIFMDWFLFPSCCVCRCNGT